MFWLQHLSVWGFGDLAHMCLLVSTTEYEIMPRTL